MRILFVSTVAAIGLFSLIQESETSEYQPMVTPEQYTEESFLRKQKREDKLNGILVASLTTDNIDDMLVATKRLKDASNGRLPHQLIVRLFAKQSAMTTEQKNIMLSLISGNMSKAYVTALTPLLLSDTRDIAEQAYSLLTELPYNYQTKHLYLKLSHASKSEQVRNEIKSLMRKRAS